MQAAMVSQCDRSWRAVSWSQLAELQLQLVDLVGQLGAGQLYCTVLQVGQLGAGQLYLALWELQSLVHLAHLARSRDMVQGGLAQWAAVIQQLQADR